MAIFKAREAIQEKMIAEKKAYIHLTDLLGVPQNDFKDIQRTAIMAFGIKVDTSCFTAYLPKKKLDKVTRATAKIFNQKSFSFINMQLLVGFFSCCYLAVKLGRVFLRRLWEFINHFPRVGPITTLRKILAWVREDLKWWNKLLPAYNGILFLNITKKKYKLFIPTHACTVSAGFILKAFSLESRFTSASSRHAMIWSKGKLSQLIRK